jgi:hypothetical protein
MNNALEIVKNWNISNGYSTDNDDVLETLTESHVLYREHLSSDRWWETYMYVIKLDEHYIGFTWAEANRDESVRELGFEFDFDSICEVEQLEKTVIVYEKIA